LIGALPPDANPEENLYEQLKKEDYISVTKCPCRQIEHHGHGEEACDCIMECCMPLGDFGRFDVDQGYARRITVDEAIKILDECAKKGQLLQATPGLVICNCCRHGCINLYAQKLDKPHCFVPNHFFAVVDPDTCASCEVCVERCPVNAIHLDDAIAVVGQTKCIGCGSCVVGCDMHSIRMNRRPEEEIAKIETEMVASIGKMMSMVTVDPIVLKNVSAK
jgi:Na+-translocating ferredoxin:NAD+ oxidoreductase subunit B